MTHRDEQDMRRRIKSTHIEYFRLSLGALRLRLYPEVPVLRMVVVKRVMNRHRVRMLRMRVTEELSAAVTGVALSAPCRPVRAGCRGLT